MKSKMLILTALMLMIFPDTYPQQGSSWSRIPESIRSRKAFKRAESDYIQRAYPYDTIPLTRYRKERTREINNSRQKLSQDVFDCIWHSLGPRGVIWDTTVFFGGHWGVVSGRVRAVAVHPTNPDIVYIGAASGGIWKTMDGGNTWLDIGRDLESLSFGAIAIDSNNPETIYAGSGEALAYPTPYEVEGKGLFKSMDGGQTWEIITNGFGDNTHFSDIIVNPNNPEILFASLASGNWFVGSTLPNEGIWKSTDAGLTWIRTLEGDDAFDVAFSPANTTTVYATLGGMNPTAGFYISTDEGLTWTQSNNGLPDPAEIARLHVDVSKSSPNILYAVSYKLGDFTSELLTKAFKSVNGGNTWNQISVGTQLGGKLITWVDQGWYDLCIAVDPVNPNHVFIGNVELHETTDGSLFSPVRRWGGNSAGYSLVHADYHKLVYAPSNPSDLFIGCDGGIFKSEDNGATALPMNDGLETMQFYRIASSPFDESLIIGGMQDNGGAMTRDQGLTWKVVYDGDGMECFFDYYDTALVYGSTQQGDLRKSINGGREFGAFYTVRPACWIAPFFIHPTDHTTVYAGSRHVFKKTGTSPFTMISLNVVPDPAFISTMAQSRIDPDKMILASSLGDYQYFPLSADSLFKVKISTDGGYNWNDVTENIPGETRWIARVACDPLDANTMYVLRTGFSPSNKVYKTTDLGSTWTNISGDLPDFPCNDIFIDPEYPDHIYVATDFGVYRSNDSGITWEYQGEGMPFVSVRDFDYVVYDWKRLLRIGTYGRSIYETTLEPFVGVDNINHYGLKIIVEPNPFTGSTTFHYSLNEPARVTLQIFNIFGQSVDTPVSTFQSKGEQKLTWNARDHPAGMYFYRIEAGGMVGMGKVIKQ